jgi:hypothetical protein
MDRAMIHNDTSDPTQATHPVEILESPLKDLAGARTLINADEEDPALAVCHSCRCLCKKLNGDGVLGRRSQGERKLGLVVVS